MHVLSHLGLTGFPGAGNSMEKIKLGFLTVQGDEENHSQMMGGVFEAAEKHNVSVIRFTVKANYEDYGNYNIELHNLYKVIEAQKLDGLMFLGWMPGLVGIFFEDFLKRFSFLPIVSIGADYPNIPNVFCDPQKGLIELMEHLIHVHGCKNIVFVPPTYPDQRRQIYNETMKKNDIFQEDLIISDDALRNTYSLNRMKKVLSILIDDRKVDIDAIMVLFDSDAQTLYKELNIRGISIPWKIAIASNEDNVFAKYSLPPLTVVTFPWREVGYRSCEKLIQIIHHEKPENSTGISGKLIIRSSCGCRSNSVKLSKIEDRLKIIKSDGEVDFKQIMRFSGRIRKEFPYTLLNTEKLLRSLVEDLEGNTTTCFFAEFAEQLQKIVNMYPYRDNVEEIEDYIYTLRNMIISRIAHKGETVILFEDIFHKATILIGEKFDFIVGYDNIEMKVINQELHFVSQGLTNTINIKSLLSVLENSLKTLEINSCYIFLSTNKSFEEFSWIFEYSNGSRLTNNEDRVSHGFILDEIVEKHPKLLCQLLHIEDDCLGFVVYEPTILDARIYETFSLHISSALKTALLLENLTEEIALRKEQEKQLIHYANYDSLTDLYNRRYFMKTIQYILDPVNSSPAGTLRFYLLFIDFDDFKQVNDMFGHDVGDLLIIEISKRFKNLIRPFSYLIPEEIYIEDENGMSEALFRLGGDEFTAIISDISIEEMKKLATELVNTVKTPYLIDGNEVRISCSVGICIYPDHADTAELLVKHADQAMYHAKKGKNQFFFYKDGK